MFTRLLIALALLAGAAQAKAQTVWPDEIICTGTGLGTLELYLTASPAMTKDSFNNHYLYINPYWTMATNGLEFNADGSPYITLGTKMPGCTGIAISKLVTRSFGSGSGTPPPPPAPITLDPTKVALAASDFTGGWVIVNSQLVQNLTLPVASATGLPPGAKLICFSVEGQGPLQLTVPAGSGWFTGAGTSPTQTALQTASFCLWADGTNYHIAGGAP